MLSASYLRIYFWGQPSLNTNLGKESGELSGIKLGYELDDRGFESRREQGLFLFTTASRPALVPTQPPIPWVPGPFFLGIKRPRREADHPPPSSADVKDMCGYSSTPPIRLHGAVLS
jgi:hypothetical protein